jgi:uncharacterized protein with von Willebrand factor type A (vWA) domain
VSTNLYVSNDEKHFLLVHQIPDEDIIQNSFVEEVDENASKEYIIVIDRSGSMGDDNKIEKAKTALILFIQSLPPNSKFNVISFGSNYTALFNESVKYNEKSKQKCLQAISKFDASMYGWY